MAWAVAANIKGPAGPTGPQGSVGPQGPPGPVGPAGLNWRGAWNTTDTYAEDDAVGWGGSSYFATTAHAANDDPPTGTAADPGANDAALNAGWALLATEGAQGPTGPAGAAGADGATGPAGPTGPTGTRGSQWYVGSGAPGTIAGAIAGDKYLDSTSGDVYSFS